MKMILRIYEDKGATRGKSLRIKELNGIVRHLVRKYPGFVFEPYMELDDSCVVDICRFGSADILES